MTQLKPYKLLFTGIGANNNVNTQELTDIKSATAFSDYFELDLHSFGTKFTNTGIYQAIRDCNLLQLQKCIEYGELSYHSVATLLFQGIYFHNFS